uniref:NAD(P)H-quinone oxidoreductase subunit 5, chloroplastic n=1 Tax=Selaginella remotifolia TaxID=137170 RepID=A0A482CH32_SELRE|nr:NADH-plastoquinone oxidoreductase subunit 5 [Selaginella remotifolia]QBL76305.1 NADH-plastoquinone oxidoreductase subunit 5 [Selaginella remotifolia]
MILIYQYAWMVPSLPLASPTTAGLGLPILPAATRTLRRAYASISTFPSGLATLISIHIAWRQIAGDPIHRCLWSRVVYNDNVALEMGYSTDPLTSIMPVLITTVGVMVMIHSGSHMSHDRGYLRFFAHPSPSNALMPGLVPSPNLIQIHVFRELVGMCPYPSIGSRFTRASAATACQKAFVTNRAGDFGSSPGVSGPHRTTGSSESEELSVRCKELFADHGVSPFPAISRAAPLLTGPVAKSAQFPLHTWLPDATEGPTPISAPIHAATTVVAGISSVARMFPPPEAPPPMMSLTSWVGGVTAPLGATIAPAHRDFKRVLAYSTMSQLGYTMLALGAGSHRAAMSHAITHAHSKALVLLGPGSVTHPVEPVVGHRPDWSQNMAFTGGIRKRMPIAGTAFPSGTPPPCGIPPFACFRSKEEILDDSWSYPPVLGRMARFTAGSTGSYTPRMYLLTFEGNYRANLSGPVPPASTWEEIQNRVASPEGQVGGRPDPYSVGLLAEHSVDPFGHFVDTAGEADTVSSLALKYDPISRPKESGDPMLPPLVVSAIPTLASGFIGVPRPVAGLGFDLLSDWLDPLRGQPMMTVIMTSGGWPDLPGTITPVAIALSGTLIAYKPYGPGRPRVRLPHEVAPEVAEISGYFPSKLYGWSYYRGYVDRYYAPVPSSGVRVLAETALTSDNQIIDGPVNGAGVLGPPGGEGLRYGEGGRISHYSYGSVLATPVLSATVMGYNQGSPAW